MLEIDASGISGDTAGHSAVMESGMGGISVLAALTGVLPDERFSYFGDSANTPYGEKPVEWVLARTRQIIEGQIERGAKAAVIACNTATSVAAESLRSEFEEIPIIGIEPALKPAAQAFPHGRILVMATPMTLHLEKFQHLADQWGAGCTVVPLACDGLAAAIENEGPGSDAVHELLTNLVGMYRDEIDAAVLGCTHYPLAAQDIRTVLGDVPLFDGAMGTAHQLRRVLSQRGLLASTQGHGGIEFATSSPDDRALERYNRFYEMARQTISECG